MASRVQRLAKVAAVVYGSAVLGLVLAGLVVIVALVALALVPVVVGWVAVLAVRQVWSEGQESAEEWVERTAAGLFDGLEHLEQTAERSGPPCVVAILAR